MTELGDPLEVPRGQRQLRSSVGTGGEQEKEMEGMEVQGRSLARVGESKADHQKEGGGGDRFRMRGDTGRRRKGVSAPRSPLCPQLPACQ